MSKNEFNSTTKYNDTSLHQSLSILKPIVLCDQSSFQYHSPLLKVREKQ